jgi:hypothetical protein
VNHVVVSYRIDSHSLLRKAEKQFAPTSGSAAIETERKLIQVLFEVLVADRSLMGPDQPSLEQRNHAVNPWHQFGSSLFLPRQKRDLVLVA